MEAVYELGSKMIESLSKEKVTAGCVFFVPLASFARALRVSRVFRCSLACCPPACSDVIAIDKASGKEIGRAHV